MTEAPVVEILRTAIAATGEQVEAVRETHVSWVALTERHAYKLKKPVSLDFVDQTTPDLRRALCEDELSVNADLAGDVVLRVEPITGRAGAERLGGNGPALDWVVVMRRFDEHKTMAGRLADGTLTADHVVATARRLRAFHDAAARPACEDPDTDLAAAWDRNAAALATLAPRPARVEALRRAGAAFISRRRSTILARAEAGAIVDGDGDLRAEHVLLEDDGVVRVVDRLEFDPRLRRVDVGDDLAFLLMDLERLGHPDVAAGLIAAYRADGGDPGDDELVAGFARYRAEVRAKVAFERAAGTESASAQTRARAEADALLGLAERLAWRARGRIVLCVCGPPASGKSTLATALGERLGAPVLSSDRVRRALGAPDYSPAGRGAVYAELGRRAAALAPRGVIVDATFGDPLLADAFRDAAGLADARLVWVECVAPLDVRLARATRRAAAGDSDSDADAEVAERLAGTHSSCAAAGEPSLEVDTRDDLEDQQDSVLARLDQNSPAGCSS
ncbi:MAG: AAA family ATPase [Solirubrobacteraceae bacterium]|nr:AAA family ATPase [Solirubrobacteraceae bacterium]